MYVYVSNQPLKGYPRTSLDTLCKSATVPQARRAVPIPLACLWHCQKPLCNIVFKTALRTEREETCLFSLFMQETLLKLEKVIEKDEELLEKVLSGMTAESDPPKVFDFVIICLLYFSY